MSIFRRKPAKTADTSHPPVFNPAAYGLVPDAAVVVDPARGDVEVAEAMRAARGGDWKPAAGLVAATGSDWNLRFSRVETLAFDALGTSDGWLRAWSEAQPDSPDMAVVLAQFLTVQARRLRGAARARETSMERFEAFFQANDEAEVAALRAIELAPSDPTPWVTRIMTALGRQIPHREFAVLWEELNAREPLHRRGHTHAHQYWLAKWFGSEELSAEFVAQATARAPRTALAFELNIHRLQECWLAVSDDAGSQADYCRSGPGRPLLEGALSQWDGSLPAAGPYRVVDLNLLAWALVIARRYHEACDVFRELGGCVTAGYPWIYYEDAAHTFRAARSDAFVNASWRPLR